MTDYDYYNDPTQSLGTNDARRFSQGDTPQAPAAASPAHAAQGYAAQNQPTAAYRSVDASAAQTASMPAASTRPVGAQAANTQPPVQPTTTQAVPPSQTSAYSGYTAPTRPVSTQAASAPRTIGNTDSAPRYSSASVARHSAPAAATVATGASANQAKAAKQKKQGGGLRSFLLGFLGAALAFLILSFATGSSGLTADKTLGSANDTSSAPAATAEDESLVQAESAAQIPTTDAEWRAETVAAKVLPSIAAIDTYATASDYGFWGYGDTASNSGALQALGLGSGVVISEDGYILTNYHVLEGAEKVMVTVDGQEFEGTVAGTDAASDLAVIKVESEQPLTAVEIGSSSDLRPGQWVMTLGSPFGLEQSVATGIVSAVSRTVVMGTSDYSYGGQSEATSIYANMIQTDAAINPGNSGGALVDEHGKLIGINSVIESYSGSYSGVGFAIPVDYAMNIAQQIIDGKTPTHAQLGVATTTVTSALADSYDLGTDKGAYVRTVYENSGASEAGLQTGDIITKVNDTTIETSTDLVAAVRAYNVGDTVTISYVRGNETQTVDIVLGSDENANISVGPSRPDEGQYNDYNGDGQGGQMPGQGTDQGQGYSYDELQELLDYFGYN